MIGAFHNVLLMKTPVSLSNALLSKATRWQKLHSYWLAKATRCFLKQRVVATRNNPFGLPYTCVIPVHDVHDLHNLCLMYMDRTHGGHKSEHLGEARTAHSMGVCMMISFHRLGELMKQVVNCTFYIMCLRILDSLGNNLSVSFSSYLSQCTVNAENSAKCQASFESLAGWRSFIINRSLFTYISWLGYGVAVSLFTRLVRFPGIVWCHHTACRPNLVQELVLSHAWFPLTYHCTKEVCNQQNCIIFQTKKI